MTVLSDHSRQPKVGMNDREGHDRRDAEGCFDGESMQRSRYPLFKNHYLPGVGEE